MNMPAFTADASLYKVRGSYRMPAAGSASTLQVVPQAVVCTIKSICAIRCGPTGCWLACVPYPDCREVPVSGEPPVIYA
jgi:hypothetical protein